MRANREQVDQFREASPADFYAPIAGMFRADPRRTDEPTLEVLRALVESADTVLDIGAGGGRYALPLALLVREVIALDPSEGMLDVLREGMAEHDIGNMRVIAALAHRLAASCRRRADRAPRLRRRGHRAVSGCDGGRRAADVRGGAARAAAADRGGSFWPAVHGVERAALPALPEFLALLLARGKLFEVQLVERAPQAYAEPDQALAWLRDQLWTRPDGAKDLLLQRLMRERLQERDGRYALSWSPVRVGIVTWQPRKP